MELAKRGAHLGIIVRNQVKANDVAAQLKAINSGKTTVDVFLAELSSQQSVREAADILRRWRQFACRRVRPNELARFKCGHIIFDNGSNKF